MLRRVFVTSVAALAAILMWGTSASANPIVPVRPGDTYSGLVERHCAPGTSWQSLDFGGRNKNLIYAGETIDLRCTGGTTAARAPVAPPKVATTSSAQRIVNYALAQVGKPYRWAASGPYAYDCSGLVMMALRQVGVYVPHQDQQILYSGKGWTVSRGNLRPGDIVWPYRAGHVVVYIGNGQIVEAAGRSRGVIRNNLYSFYTAKRYV